MTPGREAVIKFESSTKALDLEARAHREEPDGKCDKSKDTSAKLTFLHLPLSLSSSLILSIRLQDVQVLGMSIDFLCLPLKFLISSGLGFSESQESALSINTVISHIPRSYKV